MLKRKENSFTKLLTQISAQEEVPAARIRHIVLTDTNRYTTIPGSDNVRKYFFYILELSCSLFLFFFCAFMNLIHYFYYYIVCC